MGHQAGGVGHGVVILRLPLVDHLHPVGVLLLLNKGEHPAQDIADITDNGKIHIHVLAQLTGVDIDLDDGGVLGKGLGVQGHAVRKAGAQCDQHVTVRDRPVGGVAAVHSDHADVHRVTVGHNACSHQSIGGGDLRLVDQVTQGLAGSRAPHAAAKIDQRALGRIDDIGGPLDLLFVVGGHGADLLRLLGSELTDSSGDILGDIHQHRALAATLRNAERRTHGVGQLFYLAHREVVLGDGHRDALDVRLLKAVLAQTGGRHIAGKGDHGHGVHVGSGNAGDQIGGTRAAGGQHHAGAARCAGIAIGRMRSALLVGGQHMVDAVRILIQLVVQVQHSTAGIAEDGVHALFAEDFNKNLRTIQLHGKLLLFLFLLHSQQNFPQTRHFSHLAFRFERWVNYTINRAFVNRRFVK